MEFLICLVLTILGYVPGIIYAIYVIVFQNREEYFDEYRRPLYSAWYLFKNLLFLWNSVALSCCCTNKLLCSCLLMYWEIWKPLCVNTIGLSFLVCMRDWKFLLSGYETCYVFMHQLVYRVFTFGNEVSKTWLRHVKW